MQARLVDAQVSMSDGLVTLCSVPGQYNAGHTGGRSGKHVKWSRNAVQYNAGQTGGRSGEHV